MAQISELKLDNFATLQEQLIGVDVAYMHELLDAIRSEKPEKIDSGYIANLVDKIFDGDEPIGSPYWDQGDDDGDD